MPKLKYRATITRNSKKKKPPGRKRKVQSVDMDEGSSAVTVNESTTEVNEQEGSPCSKKFKITQKEAEEIKTVPTRQFIDVMELFIVDTRVFNDIETVGCLNCSPKVNLVHNMEAKMDWHIYWNYPVWNVIGQNLFGPVRK